MSLFHVDRQQSLNPKKLEKNEYIKLLRSRVDPRSFKKLIRIVDTQIQEIQPAQKSMLNWAKVGSLFGNGEAVRCPHGDSVYLWDKLWTASGEHDKTCKYMLGILTQWRFSLDSRPWNCCKKDSGKTNEDKEDIYVTIYWYAE